MACRPARQPECFCTSLAWAQAGDEAVKTATLQRAAGRHRLPRSSSISSAGKDAP